MYFFMSVIVALFFGLTVSAEEIFRDRKILKRERFLNLSRSSYLFSKMWIMFSLSAFQTFLFVLVGNLILEIPLGEFRYWLIVFSCEEQDTLVRHYLIDGIEWKPGVRHT